MINDSKTDNSIQYSKGSNDLLSGMKRYLRIEHQDDDKELLKYLQKQAGFIGNNLQISLKYDNRW